MALLSNFKMKKGGGLKKFPNIPLTTNIIRMETNNINTGKVAINLLEEIADCHESLSL